MPLMAGVPALRRGVALAVTAGFRSRRWQARSPISDTMRKPRRLRRSDPAQRDFFAGTRFERVDCGRSGITAVGSLVPLFFCLNILNLPRLCAAASASAVRASSGHGCLDIARISRRTSE